MLTKPAIGGQWEAGIEHMYRRGALWIGRECSTYLSDQLESLEWGVGQKLFSSLVAHSRTKDRIPLAFVLCCSSTLRSWTATRPALRVVSPSRSEGKRTRRWRMAGVSDQKNADGRLSAVAAEASTWSWNRSSGARRRSSADLTWSMRYRNRLLRRSAARRARIPR